MPDRTTKFLLAAIALLLLALLVRPNLALPAAEAQSGTQQLPSATQMTVSGGTIFILQNGRLSLYQAETKASKSMLAGTGLDGPVTLRHLATQDISKL